MQTRSAMTSRIVLVRHAKPVISSEGPAHTWPLDPSAFGSIARLSGPLRALGVDAVVASPEAKARETGRIIAAELEIPFSTEIELREQGGGQVPWIESAEAFRAAVAEHFARADEIVLGSESSRMAVERFENAVSRSCMDHRNPVLVTHGRIMCGYMASILNLDPMEIWPTLSMPDALAIDLDTGRWCRVSEEEPL